MSTQLHRHRKMSLSQFVKALDAIPTHLPFTRGPCVDVSIVQAFSRRDVAVYSSWLLGWFGAGVVGVSTQSVTSGIVYLASGIGAYLLYLRLACTKCPYHGKRCYMGGGQIAGALFSSRKGDYTVTEDVIVPLLWIGVSAYPVVHLLLHRQWVNGIGYSVLAGGWQIAHKRFVCRKCLNTKCGLNPRFVGRPGLVQVEELTAGRKLPQKG